MTKGLENGWQVGEASSDFDVRRAFAHGEYMGALREQERIIKLLEADKCACHPDCDSYEITKETIALIKGGNND